MRRRNAPLDPDVDRGLRDLDAALAGDPGADPDLVALVADLDAMRPEPDAAFLAALDVRVHDGFRAPADASAKAVPWPVRLRRSPLLVPGMSVVAATALVVVIVALPSHQSDSGSSSRASTSEALSSSSSDVSASSNADATPESKLLAARGSTSAAGKAAPATSRAPQPAIPSTSTPRKVQRAAELTLTPDVDDVQDVADGVVRATQSAGGYVQRSEVATQDGGGTASLTLRVPSARLDALLASVSQLAHVGALTQSSTDITATAVSAADRLADARDERRALLRALGRATTDRQIASLRARLRDNRSQLAARKGELDAVRRRADLATVDVSVQGADQPSAKDDGGWTPRDALHDAGRVLEIAGGVALIALAVFAPLAVLAALAWLAARALRRRRRESALDQTV